MTMTRPPILPPDPQLLLNREGIRPYSTVARCQCTCSGNRRCSLASRRPHTWHICEHPTCTCHSKQPGANAHVRAA